MVATKATTEIETATTQAIARRVSSSFHMRRMPSRDTSLATKTVVERMQNVSRVAISIGARDSGSANDCMVSG